MISGRSTIPCGLPDFLGTAFAPHFLIVLIAFAVTSFGLMPPQRARILPAILIAALLLALARPALAQVFDFDSSRVPMAEVTGPWRFHTGDDPRWARPGFDDSGWSLLTADKGWSEQGYKDYAGVAWYRIQVSLATKRAQMALFIPNVDDSVQVFANGRLVGQAGDMPPRKHYLNTPGRLLFPIPGDVLIPGRTLTLAVRVWHWPILARFEGGGLHPAPRIGEAQAVEDWRQLQDRNVFWNNTMEVVEFYGNGLTALACLGLFLLRRSEREYLLFGLSLSMFCLIKVIDSWALFRNIPFVPYVCGNICIYALGCTFRLEFYVAFLRQKRRGLYWTTLAAILVSSYGYVSFLGTGHLVEIVYAIGGPAILSCEIAMMVIAGRSGVADAPILLVPLVAAFFPTTLFSVTSLLSGHAAWAGPMYRALVAGIQWPFPIGFDQLTGDLNVLAILLILIRHFARSRREESRMATELESARALQSVLVPSDSPDTPGFAIASIYRPAGQVGGDFFQILPMKSVGVLAVIGDVSGKGMPAAMTVSLLVGAVRTLVHYTQSPGAILTAMNQSILARSAGGFTTCLVVRADSDGSCTVANAGHLAPYRNGVELPLENGLPLGLDAAAIYAESNFQLGEHEHLTLMTDGVVEARNKSGELFGFERTAAIATDAAEAIAKAAQDFGQEDDITVLTLTRIGAGQKSVGKKSAPALSSPLA